MAAQRRISQDVFGVLVLADGRTLAPGDVIPVGARVPRQYVVGGAEEPATKADGKQGKAASTDKE